MLPTRFLSTPNSLELARKTNTVFLFYWIAPVQSQLWAITPSGIMTTQRYRPMTEIRSHGGLLSPFHR